MFRRKKVRLKELIQSFDESALATRLPGYLDMIGHGEIGLALEMLSDDIYEYDVPVSPEQEQLLRVVSPQCNVPLDYHAFFGFTPPYPDLRTDDQISENERAEQGRANPSVESVAQLARLGRRIEAIRMYRAMTGSELGPAQLEVDRLAKCDTETT